MRIDLEKMSPEELRELKRQIEQIEKEKHEQYKGKQILGFKICLIHDRKRNKTYKFWRAYSYINGKNHVIHIGATPIHAKTKIKEYLRKHQEVHKALSQKKN